MYRSPHRLSLCIFFLISVSIVVLIIGVVLLTHKKPEPAAQPKSASEPVTRGVGGRSRSAKLGEDDDDADEEVDALRASEEGEGGLHPDGARASGKHVIWDGDGSDDGHSADESGSRQRPHSDDPFRDRDPFQDDVEFGEFEEAKGGHKPESIPLR